MGIEMYRVLISRLFLLVHVATLGFATVLLYSGASTPALGLLLLTAAPVFQALTRLEPVQVAHHKVRLPLTSVVVFAGLAVILVSVGKDSDIVLLSFLNIAVFLLDTYWLRA